MTVKKDDFVEGAITGITNFGAFVKIDDKTTGLVHISEIADTFVKDINSLYKVGDVVKVKILKIDDKGKLVLSIKKASPPSRAPKDDYRSSGDDFRRPKKQNVMEDSGPSTFEDKLARFMKDSEEIQLDARRSKDLTRKKKKSR